MLIRMRAEDSYPLDDTGRERVLPYGGAFEVPDTLAEAMIARGTAEPVDPPPPPETAEPVEPPLSAKPARAGKTTSAGQ